MDRVCRVCVSARPLYLVCFCYNERGCNRRTFSGGRPWDLVKLMDDVALVEEDQVAKFRQKEESSTENPEYEGSK